MAALWHERLDRVIRDSRGRAGLTQRQLADLAGISVASLRDLEQGRVSSPSFTTVRRLASALQLSANETENLVRIGASGRVPAEHVWVRVLGPLAIRVGSVDVDPGSNRQRVLLGLLALSANTPVSRDVLIEAAWGERPPPTALDLLQAAISRVRRRLRPPESGGDEPGLVTATHGGYQLTVTEDQLDLLAFNSRVAQARNARQEAALSRACDLYAQAASLWRDDPLADLIALQDHPAVVALVAEYQSAVLEYAEAAAELGRHEEVVSLLRGITTADPLNERAHAALMVALAGSGLQAEALALFDEINRSLSEELGADPGPELRSAQQRVLRQEVNRPEPAPAVSAHHQLPPDISDFTGRAAALRELRESLPISADGSTALMISAIEGMGGVGKTRLALRLAHQLRAAGRYSDEQLYVDLRGHSEQPPADPADVLASFLLLLGVPGEQIPPNQDGRSALYRDRLHGKNALVLLDNAASEAQVLPLLPAGATNLVLITTRRSLALDGAHVLELDVFTEDEAEELLAQIAGRSRVAADPAAAHRVVELCGRLPLAVTLAARRLQSRPSWGMADLVNRLTDAEGRLGELAAGTRRLRAVFDFSYQALDADKQRMFRLLGLVPGDDFSVQSIAPLVDLPAADARQVLDRLVDEHLVSAVEGSRYRLHDLLRDYTRTLATSIDDEHQRHAAVRRLLDYCLHTTIRATDLLVPVRWRPPEPASPPSRALNLTSVDKAVRWLDAERACLVGAVALAVDHGLPTHAWQLAHVLQFHLDWRGHIGDWVRTHETALAAAIATGDQAGEAAMRSNLGRAYVHQDQGRLEEAREHLLRALELHVAAGHHTMEASTLNGLGILHRRLGDYSAALEYTEQALQLYMGANARSAGALSINVGILLLPLGRVKEAMDRFEWGLVVARQSGDLDNENVALTNIGDVLRRQGRPDAAVEHLEQALAIAITNDLPPNAAYAQHSLANTYRQMGRLDDALACMNEVLRTVRAVRGLVSESEVMIDLGAIHADLGDMSAAERVINTGLRLTIDKGERFQQVRAYEALAELHQRAGNNDLARDQSDRAAALRVDLGMPASAG